MEHNYYKQYFDLERIHWWFVAREKIIISQIKLLLQQNKLNKDNLKILNIGCGTGRSSEYLAQFGEVTSLEYDKFCCEFTSKKTGLTIINGSITELPFNDNKFDLVCAFDVIEHVEDHQKAVDEMLRVCKINGINLITVPAFMSMWGKHDEINHHFRRYRLYQIKKLYSPYIKAGKEFFSSYFNFYLFIPILLFRYFSKIINFFITPKTMVSDFGNFNTEKPGVINNFLQNILLAENYFLIKKIPLPFGVSIIYSWKKTN